MASFNADILLAVKRSSQLDAELRKLNADIDKIARKAADIKVGAGVKGAERARLKAEQEALKVRAESFGVVKATTRELERQAKIQDTINNVRSQRIARINNERARGLSQFASPIGPQPDRLAAKRNAQLKQRQKLASTIAFQTKLELQFAQRLSGVERLITKEQQKQISAGQSLQRQKERALKAAEREAKLAAKTAAAADKRVKTQRRQKFQQAALGVGFPLLFGGGAGSIIGGLAGSAGGFGGQILGSAIGQQIDNFVAKAAELGQALNKLTPDIDALTKAAGIASTETELLIKSIEKLEGAQAAQELAAAQLATVVGRDGVAALEDAGAAAQEFTNEAAKAFTALSVALAPALTAIAKFLASNIEESRLLSRTDPGVFGSPAGDLADNKEVVQIRDYLNKGIITELTARERLLDIVREIEAADQRIADSKAEAAISDSVSLQIAESKADLLLLQGDLTDKAVYLKQIEIAGLEFEKKLREGNLSILDKMIAKQQFLNTLQGLENKRNQALERSRERGARDAEAAQRKAEAAQRKEQQVQRGIAGEKLKQLQLDNQFSRLGETKLAQVQMQLDSFDDITDLQ